MTERRRASETLSRCPACGQRLDTPTPSRCPLCQFNLGGAPEATSDDATPYAVAYSNGSRAWWRMLRWVCEAGAHRLKHVALMRASAASRHFAFINVLLLSFAVGLLEWTRTGWHRDYPASVARGESPSAKSGSGWLHVAGVARPLPPGIPDDAPTDLWWNPAHMLIAVPLSIVLSFICLMVIARVARAGAALAHPAPLRKEQRMTAAILYSSAWSVFLVLGGAIAALRPLWYFGELRGWKLPLSEEFLRFIAGGLAALGAILWWFWLIRLGAAAPAATRGRLMAFFGVGFPLTFAASAAGWYYLDRAYASLFRLLGLGA